MSGNNTVSSVATDTGDRSFCKSDMEDLGPSLVRVGLEDSSNQVQLGHGSPGFVSTPPGV